MPQPDNDKLGEVMAETTSAFTRADFLNDEIDHRPALALDDTASWVEGLPDMDSAVLVVKRGPNAGSRFPLYQPVTSAGRHPSSDISLDDVTGSRRHAEFRWQGNELHIVDMESLNGTYVNRQPVESAMLVNGDEIRSASSAYVILSPKSEGGETIPSLESGSAHRS